ncbi:MAG TPA: carboxypeptidase-like regulatory domain-containing protein, partial [Melioribacteraceae bacterium]|nr:carboxypeptidase-like regulatory domain-containing protein [Melioribacteraceae bacterium]
MKNLQNNAFIGRKEKIKRSNILKFALFMLLSIFISNSVFGQQKGSISGIIKDESNNDILIGANVLIIGTSIGASTDLDGYYSIKGLNPGVYSLKISYISYNSVTVEKIIVEPGKDTKISLSLKPTSTQLGEVIVSAEMIKSTEGALLQIQKNSLNIVDGLSSELISKNNSSDGADILSRMTGVTVSDGKYAFVRGIGDRYNNTMLNGANLPSTDPEKKSFSYDLFPASLIENVLTSKTFTPDKPADFSGGLVEINTIEFPSKFIMEFSASSTYNNRSTFDNYNTYSGGKKDYLGWDDGTRSLPDLITDKTVLRGNYSVTELNEIGKSFANNWETKTKKAPLNSSYKLNIGDKFTFGETIFGYIASLNYSNSVKANSIERNNYTFEGPRYTYKGSTSTQSVMWGALLNLSLKLDKSNKISLKNIYNQNADDETINYQGAYYYNPDYRNVTSLRYVSRSLFSTQLIGEHHINLLNGLNINWNLNIAESNREEPDARRYVYVRD